MKAIIDISAEVEIEQVRRGVDAAQGAVELEVIAYETLLETTGEDYLKNITSQAVGYAPPDVGFVFLIRQRRSGFADSAKPISSVVAVVNCFLHLVQFAFLAGSKHLQQQHLVFEIVST